MIGGLRANAWPLTFKFFTSTLVSEQPHAALFTRLRLSLCCTELLLNEHPVHRAFTDCIIVQRDQECTVFEHTFLSIGYHPRLSKSYGQSIWGGQIRNGLFCIRARACQVLNVWWVLTQSKSQEPSVDVSLSGGGTGSRSIFSKVGGCLLVIARCFLKKC